MISLTLGNFEGYVDEVRLSDIRRQYQEKVTEKGTVPVRMADP
jgi:hypothetical protein